MAANLYPVTLLDADQVIQQVYDETTQALRTSGIAVLTPPPGGLEVAISHLDDSIALGDGTNLLTSTTVGSNIGLDVNIINTSAIPVTITGAPGTSINDFNEVTSVASGVLTTINTYTVPGGTTSFLKRIAVSGTNIARYEVLIDGNLVDRAYTNFGTQLNAYFDLDDTELTAGQVVLVRVLHDRPDVGDFNCRIQALEQ